MGLKGRPEWRGSKKVLRALALYTPDYSVVYYPKIASDKRKTLPDGTGRMTTRRLASGGSQQG